MMTLFRTELRYSLPKLWPSAFIFTFPALVLWLKQFDAPDDLVDFGSDWGLVLAFAAFSSVGLHKNWHNLMAKEKRPLLLQTVPTSRGSRRQVVFMMALLFHLPVVVTVLILTAYVNKMGFELPSRFMLNSLLIVSAIIAVIQAAGSILAHFHQRARTVAVLTGVMLFIFPMMIFADKLLTSEATTFAHPAVTIVASLVFVVGTWTFAGGYRGLEQLTGKVI